MEHCFADCHNFEDMSGFCYKCGREHAIDSSMRADLHLCGPSCKDLSILEAVYVKCFCCKVGVFLLLSAVTSLTVRHIIYMRYIYIYISIYKCVSCQCYYQTAQARGIHNVYIMQDAMKIHQAWARVDQPIDLDLEP